MNTADIFEYSGGKIYSCRNNTQKSGQAGIYGKKMRIGKRTGFSDSKAGLAERSGAAALSKRCFRGRICGRK